MTNSNIEQYDWVKEIGLMTQHNFRPIKAFFILGTFQREKRKTAVNCESDKVSPTADRENIRNRRQN